MTTLSVPISPELAKFIEEQTKATGLKKADIVRQALELYREEEAVQAVLKAEQEIAEGKIIRGDLDKILLPD